MIQKGNRGHGQQGWRGRQARRAVSRPRMARTGFPEGLGLPVGVASVATQGADVGQHALLRPAADRLWRHLEELGDLRGAQVPGLGWLGQRALLFLLSPPGLGTTLCCRDRMPSRVLHRLAILRCILVRLGSPAGACMDVDQSAAAGPWSFARHPPQWLPLKQLACAAIILLLGMPGRPVVTSSGRSRYCAPGRGSLTFCLEPAG